MEAVEPGYIEELTAKPYKCCGCGSPYELGEYKTCECPTNCGFNPHDTRDIVVAKPRCHWCGSIPVAHVMDGDHLCLPCCNKWAKAEGIAALEAEAQSDER